jgi:hypothetical protein
LGQAAVSATDQTRFPAQCLTVKSDKQKCVSLEMKAYETETETETGKQG